MAASSVAAFWLTALLLITVPGADWAFIISSGLSGHSARPAVAGLVLGYAAISIAVAAGVGVLVARSPALLSGLTVPGGLYLMWHGARTLARPAAPDPQAAVPASAAGGRTGRTVLVSGIGVSALNPKGLLVLLALLPQFTDPHGTWPLTAQLGFLGLVFTLTIGVFYLCLGTVSRKILHARPGAARAVRRFSGAAMIVIGALLLADRLVLR